MKIIQSQKYISFCIYILHIIQAEMKTISLLICHDLQVAHLVGIV